MLSVAVTRRLEKDSQNRVIQISLRDNSWKNFDFSSVDTIVHIAGLVPGKEKSETEFYSVNTEITAKLSEKAKQAGVKHFIYLSSMAVYGVEQSLDITKGTVTSSTQCKPNSDYGKSKLMAENALREIESEKFRVTIIRVPSIYGVGKTEYMDQYLYLSNKLPFIPVVFPNHYKSVINVVNLCELIYLIVDKNYYGIVCPDDGQYSAVDFCSAIQPKKKKSRFVGKLMEILLKNNARILDYYGAVCYEPELSNLFASEYRMIGITQALKDLYH